MEHPEESAKRFWLRIAENPRSDLDLLTKSIYWEAIATPHHHAIRLAVVRHPHLDDQILSLLTHSDFLPLLIAVAEHPNLRERTVGNLLRKQFRALRLSLARNPFLPEKIMGKLAKDYYEVRSVLAGNSRLAPEVALELAKQQDVLLWDRLGSNPSLTDPALSYLLAVADVGRVCALVHHPGVKATHLVRLCARREKQVHQTVLGRAKQSFPYHRLLWDTLAEVEDRSVALAARLHLGSQDWSTLVESEPVKSLGSSCSWYSASELHRQMTSQEWSQVPKPIEPTDVACVSLAESQRHTVCLGELEPNRMDLKALELVADSVRERLRDESGVSRLDFFQINRNTGGRPGRCQVFVIFDCDVQMYRYVVHVVQSARFATFFPGSHNLPNQ